MPWPERSPGGHWGPVRMQRIALVAPSTAMRDVLALVATTGLVEPDRVTAGSDGATTAGLHSTVSGPDLTPVVAPWAPDRDALLRQGRLDVLAGEAELEDVGAAAVVHGRVGGLLAWCPATEMARLTARIAALGGAAVPLPTPPGTDPPTLLPANGRVRTSFAPLVRTYGTVPYPDVDPTLLAGLAYVVMFGMMFGDAGQGAVLLVAGLLLRRGTPKRWPRLREAWPFVTAAGLVACVFGVLYGEFFGPTGVVPVVWLAPLSGPTRLLEVAVAVGGILMAGAYAVAVVNRWREGGPRLALYSTAGIAGALLLLGVGGAAAGLYLDSRSLVLGATAVCALGLGLATAGFVADGGGEQGRILQAVVQVVDTVIRTASNLVSFARLAAFGLTHAALAALVWSGTTALAGHGPLGLLAAIVVFTAGNALTFALEGLVAAIQALRLEYYELFSRVFVGEGRPFRPWYMGPAAPEESS